MANQIVIENVERIKDGRKWKKPDKDGVIEHLENEN